jgi:hypothetical protein
MAELREAPFGHEPPAVATRRVVGVVLILGTAVAIALVALWLALTYWVMPEHAQLKTQPAVLPPAPRLQPHPDQDLAALREEKAALLDGYAWTDKSHRFARIPIGRAMQVYVREHKPGPGTRDRDQKPGPGTRDRGPGVNGREPETGDRGHESGVPGSSSAGKRP